MLRVSIFLWQRRFEMSKPGASIPQFIARDVPEADPAMNANGVGRRAIRDT